MTTQIEAGMFGGKSLTICSSGPIAPAEPPITTMLLDCTYGHFECRPWEGDVHA